jgi:general secretion pathway protein M
MKAWLDNLEPRERRAVLLGGGAALAFLVYALVWLPLAERYEHTHQRVIEQRAAYEHMVAQAAEVRRLRETAPTVVRTGGGQSVLALVDRTAREAGLGAALKRVEPDGPSGVRVWLEQAPFRELTLWLTRLEHSHGVRAVTVTMDRPDRPGTVNARINFAGGA